MLLSHLSNTVINNTVNNRADIQNNYSHSLPFLLTQRQEVTG